MKKYFYLVVLASLALLASGCAKPLSVEIRRSEAALIQEENNGTVKENTIRKAQTLRGDEFRVLNTVVDMLTEIRGTNKKVVLMVVEDKGFPPLLDEVLSRHPKLNTLSRDPKTLFVLESKKAPGVKNIYIEVPADKMADDDTVLTWMPNLQEWSKYVDLKANRFEGDKPGVAYLKLFYAGNDKWNPQLIESVEGKHLPKDQRWIWARMLHPKDTKNKRMFIPIATMTAPLQEFFN